MERTARFIQIGDLNQLYELPLGDNELLHVGRVLTKAPSSTHVSLSGAPLPVLPDAARDHLHVLLDEDSEYTEAALFVLTQDVKARAHNHVLSKQE